jgi:addiction module HigA family antidote
MSTPIPCHPGTILKERFLDPLGITPYRLAKCVGVPTRRISELVRGRRRISRDTAVRLGLFFDVPATWWLEIQARFDAESVPGVDRLRERIRPYGGLEDVLVTPTGVRRFERSRVSNRGVLLVPVRDDVLKRLKQKAASGRRRVPRKLLTVTYSDGATALVGRDG